MISSIRGRHVAMIREHVWHFAFAAGLTLLALLTSMNSH
jgi:hypothetical protein